MAMKKKGEESGGGLNSKVSIWVREKKEGE